MIVDSDYLFHMKLKQPHYDLKCNKHSLYQNYATTVITEHSCGRDQVTEGATSNVLTAE